MAVDYEQLLGTEMARDLLDHRSESMPSSGLILPGPRFVDRVLVKGDLPNPVLRSIETILDHGRLGGSGYLSILPVDQGMEHSGGRSFSPNPNYFDPENIIKLAIEGECSAIASTASVLGSMSREYAHRIPMIMKFNHNDSMNDPKNPDQTVHASVEQAFNMGAVAVGATVYFGSPTFKERAREVSEMFQHAHERGMAAFLWTYVRNTGFGTDVLGPDGEPVIDPETDKVKRTTFEVATELCAQANHLGANLRPDFIKQKEPEFVAGSERIKKEIGLDISDSRIDQMLKGEHPIDMMRYLILNCMAGRIPMLTSGGPSRGEKDEGIAIRTAITNKRAGGIGEIMGRKSFQCPMEVGVKRIHMVQDVYLDPAVTIA